MKTTILTEEELRTCVSLDEDAVDAIAAGFTKLALGGVTVPPVLAIEIPEHHGEVDVKTAVVRGLDRFAIKIASGFFDNHLLGLPSGSGMMVVVSAVTGRPEAILLDNGYLTDVRTGAAGAVAARHLARERVNTVGVIGAGVQARYQIRALKLVRDFHRLLVYSRTPEAVDRYSTEMSGSLGVEVIKAEGPERVVRESDLVVTTTPARTPYLNAGWLHPGLHITCMGSDGEEKQELCADVFGRVDRIVCDRKSQCIRIGELHHALQAGVISPDDEIIELGQLTSGQVGGRTADDEITVCDLTGVGVQDTQIALLAYERAQARALGITVGD
jgi:ornithine cyclodeaminase